MEGMRPRDFSEFLIRDTHPRGPRGLAAVPPFPIDSPRWAEVLAYAKIQTSNSGFGEYAHGDEEEEHRKLNYEFSSDVSG